MVARQQAFRFRRSYNQWVNDETLEDYALRFTAKSARRWSLAWVANTALGAISFLALEAIGASVTISFGFANAVAATLVVGAIIFLAGLPICYYSAKHGVDIDLLTRGAGFGYIGSTVTSLIYASFTFIFFALEAAIMAKALELLTGLPLVYGYIVSSVVVIPLVFYGITFISRFQLGTQPFWVVLQLLPFGFILWQEPELLGQWRSYVGAASDPGLNLIGFGAAAAVMFSLVAQIGEQVDFLRFLPEKTVDNRLRWWAALIAGGPGWIVVGGLKILAGSFLAVVALEQGAQLADAADPATMYRIAFEFVLTNGDAALLCACLFVILSQLKINVTNAYAGSIAWSNFFSRLTHSHPGRVVWLVFNVSIALILMEIGVYQAFESMLSAYAIVAVSWVATLVADLVINKPLGLSPPHIEFKRGYLYDINPVGVGATLFASALAVLAYLGVAGPLAQSLAHFIALGSALVAAPLIAYVTHGRYYIARSPTPHDARCTNVECSICDNGYEPEDTIHCPAYGGSICSLCCSLDTRCGDACKRVDSAPRGIFAAVRSMLPRVAADRVSLGLVQFCVLLLTVALITGVLLELIYLNIQSGDEATDALLRSAVWKVFFGLTIVAGVLCWLFVLAHESRALAEEESQTHTRLLMEEIAAHEQTDRELQDAKEHAEAANNAKSRYLTGISHELRSPLNAVLGYAQLMEMDQQTTDTNRQRLTIIRQNGQHLADLIEGLLDISKIEAGRLEIQRNHIALGALMAQIAQMFADQAKAKGLEFSYACESKLPEYVNGDEKRLRQILLNLLTNAVKFTPAGQIDFKLRYRNDVAEIRVADTGIGIPEADLERIFKPFERVRRPGQPSVPGTGLGLTITQLLTEVMGGEIAVNSNPAGGTTFTVWLMLSAVPKEQVAPKLKPKRIVGYRGPRRSIMVVDDDPSHRGLFGDLLNPLGFPVVEAPDGPTCLEMIKDFTPDVFIIDRRMPGMDGFTLIGALKGSGIAKPIIMVSANANEDADGEAGEAAETSYDEYLVKPVRLDKLLELLAFNLDLEWQYECADRHDVAVVPAHPQKLKSTDLPDTATCREILRCIEIGHLQRLKDIAASLRSVDGGSRRFALELSACIKRIRYDTIVDVLRERCA